MAAPFDPHPQFQEYAHPERLVSASWLSARLGTPGLRVIESDEDSLLYDIGHLPGAVRIDWQKDLNDPVTRDIVDGEAFAALMRSKGINRDDTVVIYGDQSNWWAAFTLWVFDLFGHEDVRLLDGGRDAWMAEERDTSFVVPDFPESDYPVVERNDAEYRVFVDEMLDKIGSSTIVDVRSTEEFHGLVGSDDSPALAPALRRGHIPTAVFWHNADPDGLHLTVSETGWAKSVWGKLYGQWLAETAIFVYDHEKFVPAQMLKAICEHKVTTFCAPPTVYRYFIKEDLSQYDFSHMKWATTAGEPLNPEVFHQFEKATGLKLYEIYGQTELTVTVGTFIWMEPKPGSMGKPSPLFDVDIVNEAGEPCKWGESGEIVVRTDKGVNPGMFLGYYRDEELTRKVWHDGMYHTGDVAWKDEDGYYWYVGRTDDVIKSSGYRIGPFEVESALMEHPAVLETAITGVPHPERGQVVKATVVLAKGYEPSDELAKELQEHVKRVTAPYKYPRVIEFVDELPKTISGKIRRVQMRKAEHERTEATPRGEFEYFEEDFPSLKG